MGLDVLQGLTVLVTRPLPAGKVLCDKILQAGGQVIYLPVIKICPINNAFLLKTFSQLDQFDWLIFASPQAVYHSTALLRDHWPILPEKCKIAAIGRGTATALQLNHLLVQACPSENWSSEGLLDLPALKAIAGQRIALIKGEGGRDKLATVLAQRGATIISVPVYKRELLDAAPGPYQKKFLNYSVHVIICTSNDIIKNLKIFLGNKTWQRVCQLPMIVISERMRLYAQQEGVKYIFMSESANHDAIMSVLRQEKIFYRRNSELRTKKLCQR